MVLQRWQSLLLLVATVMLVLFSFCSLGRIQGDAQTVDVYSYGLYDNPQGTQLLGTVYVTVVTLLAAILCLVAIFMYNDTRKQKKVCLLSLVLVVAGCCSAWFAIGGFRISGADGFGYGIMAFAPVAAMLFIIAAWRCIRSDERKLASADRLR